jgi:esterase/lipase superfamily enzyme
VHFAWASAASPLAYIRDRDSALFARDGLEALIREVAAAGPKRIVLTAHSLGAGLTMETLRQIALKGDHALLRRISGVVLISPDVDVDVFRAQAHTIGDLPQPFVIFTDTNDRALGFLSMLNGTQERLGNLDDVGRLADLRVTLLDTNAFSSGAGHFTPGDSPALLAILDKLDTVNEAFAGDQRGKTGLLPGVVLTVQNATQIILAPVSAAFTPSRRSVP